MKLLTFFTRINAPFDGEIIRLDTFELRNAVKFDSQIDLETQKAILETEIAKHYHLDEVIIKDFRENRLQQALKKIDNQLFYLFEILDEDGTLEEYEQELDTLSGKFDDWSDRLREELTNREMRK